MSNSIVDFNTSALRPEINSDHSTHGIIRAILDQGHTHHSIPECLANGRTSITIRGHVVIGSVLPALKRKAQALAEKVALRAIKQVHAPGRWGCPVTPAHVATEVLLDRAFRRGPSPSQEGRMALAHWIQHLQRAAPECLKLAILALPLRDPNPAKNDGVSPDLGEASSLLRMWAVAKAISLASDAWGHPKGAWKEVHALIARDPKRYPTFLSFPARDFEAYASALGQLHGLLGLHDHLQVASLEDMSAALPRQVVGAFHARRDRLYQEHLAAKLLALEPVRARLLACGREEFRLLLNDLGIGPDWPALVEMVLHTRRHPALESLPPAERLRVLGYAFEPGAIKAGEPLRKGILWDSLVGVAQYMAAYEVNTSSRNNQGLDDLELVAPYHLRLSIHRKLETGSHFSVNIGPSLNRTPWHGTAGVYFSTRRRAVALETRLSLEMKVENYHPILLHSSEEDPPWLRTMAASHQPLAWISGVLVETAAESGVRADEAWLVKLLDSQMKYI